MTPEDKLAELGIELPPVAARLPLRAALRSGSYVYTSGQLTLVEGQLAATGKVGARGRAEQAKQLAATCALNALAAIREEVGSLTAVRSVVKVVGFVASAPDFTGQPEVINGASELLGSVFGVAGRHARSAVGVAVLPRNAPVEVEVIVEVE